MTGCRWGREKKGKDGDNNNGNQMKGGMRSYKNDEMKLKKRRVRRTKRETYGWDEEMK